MCGLKLSILKGSSCTVEVDLLYLPAVVMYIALQFTNQFLQVGMLCTILVVSSFSDYLIQAFMLHDFE